MSLRDAVLDYLALRDRGDATGLELDGALERLAAEAGAPAVVVTEEKAAAEETTPATEASPVVPVAADEKPAAKKTTRPSKGAK